MTSETGPQPVDPELFHRTAPKWNCVDDPDGMHYRPTGAKCLWCGDGKTRQQIAREAGE